jgi:hypothetical protein
MTAAEQLRCSSAEVERACALLMAPAPEALDDCSGVLEAAAEQLRALRPALHDSRGDPEALAEAWRLQRNVRRAGVLLANASAYHARWNELLGVKTAGYRFGGGAAESPRAGRLCLRG